MRPMDICALVGENIRRQRQERGWSQEELAFRAKMDRPYLSQVENGRKNISLLMLQEIATALKVQITELLED